MGFIPDVNRHRKEQRGIECRSQDFNAVITVRTAGIRRASGNSHRRQGDSQRCGVGEQVGHIGQQRQAVEQHASHRLRHQEGCGQTQRYPQRALFFILRYGM